MQTKNRISTLKEDLVEISKNVQDSKQKKIKGNSNTILSKDLCESESDADDNNECGSGAGSDAGSDNRSEIGSIDGEGSTVGDEISAASSHDMKGAEQNGFFNFFFPFVNTSKEYYSWDEGSQGSYYSEEEENACEELREGGDVEEK